MVGYKIRSIRKSKGITAKELAEKLGKTDKYVYFVENSDNLTVSTMQEFADALGVKLQILFEVV